MISGGIGRIVTALLNKIKLNQALKRMGWEEAFAKAEIKLNASRFIGEIVKWIFVIVFLMLASEIIGLTEFSDFLEKILAYLPNVVVAALIFVVAVFVSDISYRVVVATSEKAKIKYSKALGVIIRWTIWFFAILAILAQLQVAKDLVKALTYGFVAIFVIAGGLAFGLGGKDLAAEVLRKLKENITE